MSDLGSAGSARSSLNHPIKILIVGDGAVGKTALCTVFREMKKEKPPTEEELRESILSNYEPTIFENDNYTTTVEDEVRIKFFLFPDFEIDQQCKEIHQETSRLVGKKGMKNHDS